MINKSTLQDLMLRLAGRQNFASLALFLLLSVALALRLVMIEHSLPYPQHVDETFLADNAAQMLRTGDFNPHFFMYGGLPIHLTAAAFTVGFVDAANHSELRTTAEIGSVHFPYYDQVRVVRPARWLFALISVGGLWILARTARELGGLLPMVVAPGLLTLSALYFEQSQAYLNVNIVGTALAWVVIYWTVFRLSDGGFKAKVAVPGLWVGMVAACKYNFGLVLVVPLLGLWIGPGERRCRGMLALLGISAASFLLFAPFTLLDFKNFLDDLGRITYDYRQGNNPATADLGGHLAVYWQEIQEDLGLAILGTSLLGGIWLLRQDWRKLVLVAVFPAVLLFQASSMPTHFLRNILPAFPLLALLSALGFSSVYRRVLAMSTVVAQRWNLPRSRLELLAGGVLVGVAASLLPIGEPLRWLETPLRSRQDASAWLIAQLPRGQEVLIAEELGIHPRPLEKAGLEVRLLPLRSLNGAEFLTELGKSPGAPILMPRVGVTHWDPQVAQRARAFLPGFDLFFREVEPIRVFSDQEVSLAFGYPTGGAPQVTIGKSRRSPDELAAIAAGIYLPGATFEGESTSKEEGGLAIFAHFPVQSKAIPLAAGSHRIAISAFGSAARGQYPRVEVLVGEQVVGTATVDAAPAISTFDFDLHQAVEAPIVVKMLNDAVELDHHEKISADRNVWLQGALVYARTGWAR